MALDFSQIGRTSPPRKQSWRSDDALLYALGVGAGSEDPYGSDLPYVAENTRGVEQRVLPTFVTILARSPRRDLGLQGMDLARMVHGEQSIDVFDEIPTSGSVTVQSRLEGIYDKGTGAVIEMATSGTSEGRPLFESRMTLYVRGAGGFGGEPSGARDHDAELAAEPLPQRPPDDVVVYHTRTDQALLYRLSGDHNPLHSDPDFARAAGFPRPILHGLCTYGFTGRALLRSICDDQPSLFGHMRSRFTQPTYPGDVLKISIWDVGDRHSGTYRFETSTESRGVVMGNGVLRTRTPS